ncbi:hypothetical protein GCU56_07000 [Geodermatophilus sabuli]|uniref:Uncharacterized protein n=1 Tax=Geodermatophilus sabuli TaxID=1564158 RepID=A0A7K3W153_9ACTN|nr:hypothetical protein [Geodermatophilus sabuli]
MTADDLLAAIEECFERGWTDGLPVVPPVPSLVRRFLEHTDRAPSDVVWSMSQVKRGCTVEAAAINAVMAGCRPEYFPVVLAALEATVDEGWPGNGGWQSTTGGGPLLVVNGPVRQELGVNAKGNVLGPGFRPNATIGRAIRLIIMNAYGIRPHELDQATQGTPGKYSLCIAENEEDSPWEPLHVELGHAPDVSTVSALHTRSTEYVDNRNTGDAREVLTDIADTCARIGAMTARRYRRVGVVIGPEHAQQMAAQGFSKQDVKEFLVEHSGRTAGDLRRAGRGSATARSAAARPQAGTILAVEENDDDAVPDDQIVTLIQSPDDVVVVVAGAANAGVSTVAQTLGFPPKTPGCAVVRR